MPDRRTDESGDVDAVERQRGEYGRFASDEGAELEHVGLHPNEALPGEIEPGRLPTTDENDLRLQDFPFSVDEPHGHVDRVGTVLVERDME
ncbi:hypothetical protein D3C83_28280 [compost metagenome]